MFIGALWGRLMLRRLALRAAAVLRFRSFEVQSEESSLVWDFGFGGFSATGVSDFGNFGVCSEPQTLNPKP